MQQNIKTYCGLLLLIIASLFVATGNAKPLRAEQAFSLSVTMTRPQAVLVEWHIAPGYMLYVDRTHITFSPAITTPISLPPGEAKYDQEHGRYQVYSGDVTVPITLPNDGKTTMMSVTYQGCSQAGFCYPPIQKNFILDLAQLTVTEIADLKDTQSTPSFFSLLTDQNGVDLLLQHYHFSVMLLIFVGLGLLLAFTPCVLPMVPILTSIILGQKQAPGSRKALGLSLTYVFGMAVTYACAGLLAASLGSSIQVWLQKPITVIMVSGIFILLALSLFGLYELRFSRRWHNWIFAWSNRHEGGTYVGVFVMGVLSTLVVSPCVTAPLAGVLIYIGQSGNLLLGACALFAMGVGMGIPLLLIGMSAGKWLPKGGQWMKAVKEMFGIFMVAMAIWLLSRVISPAMTTILFGLLVMGTACFVGLYLPRLIRFYKINRTVGMVIGLLGILLVFNGINMTMTHSLTQASDMRQFVTVHNMTDLKAELAQAQAANQPVILDFYADWCTSCVTMDRDVFDTQKVQLALQGFVLLRADLSDNTSAAAELLKHFGVIAPPTVLFFNNSGKEVDSRRIVGELDAAEFLGRLNAFVTASCDKKVQC